LSTTRLLRPSGLIIAAAIALAACSDRAPVAPSAPASHPSALLGLPVLSSQQVKVITRATPLPNDITSGAWIGPLGGSFGIPDAGLSVVVPPGAVLSRTYFSATALKGNLVAYEFEPHGKSFLVPLVMTQRTNGINLLDALGTLMPIQAAYFPSRDGIDPATATATVTELLPVKLDLGLGNVTFTVGHFSGYLLASGRE
jgi:hypothetical protein